MEWPGPITVAINGWTVLVQEGLPAIFDEYKKHAALCDELEIAAGAGPKCFVAASRSAGDWPELVVAQRYEPAEGFHPGVALVTEKRLLFVGAGQRLLAYRLGPHPERLWQDWAAMGFREWRVHGPFVLMAAELELAAWRTDGEKLWSRFVEPPWTYAIHNDHIRLNVMGEESEFPLASGR